MTQHIIPVELSKNKLNKVMSMALQAHKKIGCRGVTRSDFKFYNNKFYKVNRMDFKRCINKKVKKF